MVITNPFKNVEKVLHGQQIQAIINCAIASARITHQPISILLVSLSGSGKSFLLNAYGSIPGIHRTDTFSATGLYNICRDDSKNQIRHLLVSDLNIPLSRKSSTVSMLIGTLLGLMTEGMVRVDDGRIEGKQIPHHPIGLLTAMTVEEFSKQAKLMHRVGLIRRLIPIFFEYRTSSEMDILQYYSKIGPNLKMQMQMPLSRLRMSEKNPLTPVAIKWPDKIKSSVIPLGQKLAENLRIMPASAKYGKTRTMIGPRIVPISPQQVIQKFCEAHAFLEGRSTVNLADLEFSATVCDFTQYGKPVLL